MYCSETQVSQTGLDMAWSYEPYAEDEVVQSSFESSGYHNGNGFVFHYNSRSTTYIH